MDRVLSRSGRNHASAIRRGLFIITVIFVGYGLFADTVRRHGGRRREPGLIRFSYWGSYDDHQMWDEIISAFESRRPRVQVRAEWLPLSGYALKIDQQLVAGDAPDVMLYQDEPFARTAEHHFAAIDELVANDAETSSRLGDCWETAVGSFRSNGRLHGLPVNGGHVLIYCNLRAFERASAFHHSTITPPKQGCTLEAFTALCQQLVIDTDADGVPEQFAFLQPHWVYYLPFIWSHGADLVDPTRTQWTLRGPPAEAAFQYYADLVLRHRVSPLPIEYAGQNSDTAFLSGRVAMCVNGPWFQSFLKGTSLRDDYAVVPIPGGPGGSHTRVTWDAVCIYANMPAARIAESYQFARFLLSRQAQETFARHQRAIPARRSAAKSFVRFGGGEGSASEAFIAALPTARMQPITRDWQAMSSAVARHLYSVSAEGFARRTAHQAVEELADDPMIRRCFRVNP